MPTDQEELVWDPFVRVFHWSVVVLFGVAYYTSTSGDDDIHAWAGYLLTLLLLGRLLWGFVGPEYARFSSFLYSPGTILQHVRGILVNRPARYLGHSPAGSVMVFALLILLATTVSAGLLSQGWSEYEGPLWALGWMPSDGLGRAAENLHEALPEWILWLLLPLHLLGVWLASVQHRENLVRAMIHGRKRRCVT